MLLLNKDELINLLEARTDLRDTDKIESITIDITKEIVTINGRDFDLSKNGGVVSTEGTFRTIITKNDIGLKPVIATHQEGKISLV